MDLNGPMAIFAMLVIVRGYWKCGARISDEEFHEIPVGVGIRGLGMALQVVQVVKKHSSWVKDMKIGNLAYLGGFPVGAEQDKAASLLRIKAKARKDQAVGRGLIRGSWTKIDQGLGLELWPPNGARDLSSSRSFQP